MGEPWYNSAAHPVCALCISLPRYRRANSFEWADLCDALASINVAKFVVGGHRFVTKRSMRPSGHFSRPPWKTSRSRSRNEVKSPLKHASRRSPTAKRCGSSRSTPNLVLTCNQRVDTLLKGAFPGNLSVFLPSPERPPDSCGGLWSPVRAFFGEVPSPQWFLTHSLRNRCSVPVV